MSLALYVAAVLRRALAFLALLAVTGSPAATSTRLFCRYTGVEIVGCDESSAPAQTQLRDEDCCLKRTFHALDPTRTLADDGPRLAAPPIVAIIAIIPVHLGVTVPSGRADRFGDVGLPVFLINRALLI